MALHPDALVVRGGTIRDAQALSRKVAMAVEDGDGAVISVFCDTQRGSDVEGMTLDQLCRVSEVIHGQVQCSTVSTLLKAGFDLEHDISDGQRSTHHHVVLEEPVQESSLQAFIDCFDEPVPNPAGGKRRSTT